MLVLKCRSPGREDYAPDEDQQIPEKYEISPFPRASSTPPPLTGEDDQDVLRYLHQISDESMTAVSNPGPARDSRIDSPQPGTPFVDLVGVKKAINLVGPLVYLAWISNAHIRTSSSPISHTFGGLALPWTFSTSACMNSHGAQFQLVLKLLTETRRR